MRIKEILEDTSTSPWYFVISKDGMAKVFNEDDPEYLKHICDLGWEVEWDSARSPEQGYRFAREHGLKPVGQKESPLDNPNFRKWFAGSKVVDKNGNPLVAYHGTSQDFEAFSVKPTKNVGRYGFNRIGFWFDTDPTTPNYFAGDDGDSIEGRQGGGNVMPCYLSIKHPLVITSEALSARMEAQLRDLWAQHKALWQKYNTERKATPTYDDNLHRKYSALSKKIMAEIEDIKARRGSDSFYKLMSLLPHGPKTKDADVDQFVADAKAEGYDGILLKDTLADDGSRGGKLTDWWLPFDPHQIKSVFNKGTWSTETPKLSEGA
jgi:hypothetical protein